MTKPNERKPSRKKELTHEALADRATVASYLRAIADGLESGKLSLQGEDVSLQLAPQRLVDFELDARRERGRSRIRVRLAWREEQAEVDSLSIKPD